MVANENMIGGVQSIYNLFPFLVEIFLYLNSSFPKHHCGGSLIRPRWVLTAAHCIYKYPIQNYYLGAGRKLESNATSKTNLSLPFKQMRRIIFYRIHEQYDKEFQRNDIALIQINRPFSPSETTIVSLPSKEYEQDLTCFFKYCYTAGWGNIGHNTMQVYNSKEKIWIYKNDIKHNNQLTYTILPLISNKQCQRLYLNISGVEFNVTPRQMCTLYYPGRKSACRGDSGGALICGNIQHGVASWSYSCGIPRFGADVYTRVDKYLDWINETIEKYWNNSNSDYQIYFLSDETKQNPTTNGSTNKGYFLGGILFSYFILLLIQ